MKNKIELMDGAMGSFLLTHGINPQSCLEELNITDPALILQIHRSYHKAGAQTLVTNTFGANRLRFKDHPSALRKIEPINRRGIQLAKEAGGRGVSILASIGPLGKDSKKMSSSEMFQVFKEQAIYLEKEKPDGFLIETMSSLGEAEAATLAVREISARSIFSLMTFPRGIERTLEKTLKTISTTLRTAGANVIGLNCGLDPYETLTVFEALTLVDEGPFCVRLTAGHPKNYLKPEDFALLAKKLTKKGCQWMGGCCGTTPAHIAAIKRFFN